MRNPRAEADMRKSMRAIVIGSAVAAALLAFERISARAAVIETTTNGFYIEQTTHINASPDRVYAALTEPAKWWDPAHTFSGSAASLTLDPRAGGCFCENLPNGGSVQHLIVVEADPGNTLRLRGPLGPFQGQGVDGALTFTLKAVTGGTNLTLDNVVGGYLKGGFAKWPALADTMLAEQLIRLKRYIETGSPELRAK
jgi:uncharacterized protein YndB with AHSA1/START domain